MTIIKLIKELIKKRLKPSKVKRKRRSKEEILANRTIERLELHDQFLVAGRSNLKSFRSAGVLYYRWNVVGDGNTCQECLNNNGKRFQVNRPPAIGHPGEHKCEKKGYCRCYASPDFEGTPFEIE